MKKFVMAFALIVLLCSTASAMFMDTMDLVVDTNITSGDVVTSPIITLYRDGGYAVLPYESRPEGYMLLWIDADMADDADRSIKIEYALYQSTVGWTAYDTLTADTAAANDERAVSMDDDNPHMIRVEDTGDIFPAEAVRFKFTGLASCDVTLNSGLTY